VTDRRRRATIPLGWGVGSSCRGLTVGKRTDASKQVGYFQAAQLGYADRTVLEVLITKRCQTKWEWRVCDRQGVTIMNGSESSRRAARYRSYRALFHLLAFGSDR
jgi:hypothetical protein